MKTTHSMFTNAMETSNFVLLHRQQHVIVEKMPKRRPFTNKSQTEQYCSFEVAPPNLPRFTGERHCKLVQHNVRNLFGMM